MYFLGVLAYRVIHESVPSYITDLFSSPNVEPRRSSRLPTAPSAFHIPLHRTTAYRNSFRLSAAYFWNSVPSDIASAPSLAIFKARLMSHIRLRELPVSQCIGMRSTPNNQIFYKLNYDRLCFYCLYYMFIIIVSLRVHCFFTFLNRCTTISS